MTSPESAKPLSGKSVPPLPAATVICRHHGFPTVFVAPGSFSPGENDHREDIRDAREKKLRHEMHWVVALLPHFIGKSDPRRLAFGLKQPRPNDEAVERHRRAIPDSAPLKIDFATSAESSREQSAVA